MSGWCPFASRVLTEVQERIEAQPGVAAAEVEIVWDEAWTTDRLSERAAGLLRFLPPPSQVGDRDAYLAAHQPGKGDQ
jgi:metal-sulfur cluster biosynthetic enzyme